MELFTLANLPKRILAKIDVQRAFIISRLITAAERLELFRTLDGDRLPADELGRTLCIHESHLRPFLNVFVSLGLLRKRGDVYWNTPLAQRYFIRKRPIEWTHRYSAECVEDYCQLTVLEEALASGRSHDQIKGLVRPSYVDSMQRNQEEAEEFTQMLFHLHQPEAQALAAHLKLGGRRMLLDIGGGSGVMSIALAKRHPKLRASVFDIAPVCQIARRNIERAGLAGRVDTIAGDILQALPRGYDVILLSDIGEIPARLLMNAYASLPSGGLLVLTDRYLSDDGIDPLDRLADHFAGSSFGLATRADMVGQVAACGFKRVSARKFYADVWAIAGVKR